MSKMIRREFFNRLGVLAAAGAVVVNAPAPAQDAPAARPVVSLKGRIKKAVVYDMISEGNTFEEKLMLLKETGFQGVEVHTKNTLDGAEVKAAVAKTGIQVHSVMHGSVENIEHAVNQAVAWGAETVLCVAGRVDEKTPYAVNYEQSQAKLRAAIPLAETNKITLLVENVWNNFLISPVEMARYVDELNSPWVGAYFDAGNIARYGWPEHWIPVLGKRMKRMHIKEYSNDKHMKEGPWKGFDVQLGEGTIRWDQVSQELINIDYNGWITIEMAGGGKDRLLELSKRMDTVFGL